MEASEYDHQTVEAAARALWDERDVYRYDPGASGPVVDSPVVDSPVVDSPVVDSTVFSVDTPPAYVSAAHLHVGHAMSYSQPDFIVRYRRMRGERVFYPMGFDDNGLPTERYVEQAYGVRAADLPRAEFVRLCLAETQRTAARYEDLWRRLGLSVDWSLRYSTIDARCQRTAQTSFVKLYEAGYLRRARDPILWCPEDGTALAQADVEDLERTSKLHRIAFGGGAGPGGEPLVIATTRPELVPACVALYCHPSDPRYAPVVGTRATVPLFGYDVPVLTDESVDPEYGSGLMMVCTFGDAEDVLKWRGNSPACSSRRRGRRSPRRWTQPGSCSAARRYARWSGCTSAARRPWSSRSGRSGSSRCARTRTASARGRPRSSGFPRSCGGGSTTGSTG